MSQGHDVWTEPEEPGAMPGGGKRGGWDAARADGHAVLLEVVGFGCLLAWNYVTFFSRVVHYSTRNDITHLNSTYTFACCGMIAVMLLVALPWRALRAQAGRLGVGDPSKQGGVGVRLLASTGPLARDEVKQRRLALGAALVICAMTFVLILVESGLFMQPWCSIASFVAGAALGLFYLVWGARFVEWPRRSMPARFALAFVIGAALFVMVLYLPLSLAHVITSLLPLASAVALHGASARVLGGAGTRACEHDEERAGRTPLPSGGHIFGRALACVGLLGFAESLERALFLEVSPIDDTLTYRWILFGTVIIAGALLLLSTVGRRGREAIVTVTHVTMFAMALLFLLTPIVAGMGLAADLATMVCYALFYLLMWTMLAQIANAYRLPVHVCFGLGLGVAFAGCLAGTFIGSLVMSFVTMGWRLASLLALVCACLVLLSFMFIVDDRTMVELVDADDERPSTPRRFKLRCERLAQRSGLTPRETEVMMLVAKGRSAQKIQEILGLSAGTVNTYLARIYKKLDIHARQELLDKLDRE